jgi:hypothetical protein
MGVREWVASAASRTRVERMTTDGYERVGQVWIASDVRRDLNQLRCFIVVSISCFVLVDGVMLFLFIDGRVERFVA